LSSKLAVHKRLGLKENYHQFDMKLHKEKEMSHFRKMLFAAAAVASFLGMGNSANAQTSNPFVCNTSFSPLVVRVEGLREIVGDIVITCTGGNSIGTPDARIVAPGGPPPIASGVVAAPGTLTGPGGSYVAISTPTVPAINLSVTVPGTRITNRIFSNTNLTDALLFIDEPTNPSTYVASRNNQNPCAISSTTIGLAGVCTGMNYFFENGIATGAGYPGTGSSQGVPANVFQGQYGVGGGFAPNEQTVTFVGVPVVQPGVFTGAGSRIFRIKGIRVQVANQFQINGQIQAFISVQNPPANLVLNNAQGVVGFVQRGLFFDTIAGGPYAQCLGFNVSSSGAFLANSTSTTLNNTGALRFTEAYGVAFKRRGFGSPLDSFDSVYNQFYLGSTFGQSNPTVNYNNESTFYNSSFPTTNGLNVAGIASNGTRLRARFVGVPSQVRLYVSVQPVTGAIATGGAIALTGGTTIGQGTSAPGSAYALAGTNANGEVEGFAPLGSNAFAGGLSVQGSTAPGWASAGFAYTGPGTMVTSGSRLNLVTIASDGTGTFVWEVLRADDNVIDRLDFQVAIAFQPTTSIVTDSNTSVVANVSGNFAPIATTGGNGYPHVPSFVLSSPEDLRPIFTITNCATNLLYPFVSSQVGFNTGIAVSNTSKDPFGTINETGICRVFFYGTTAGGGVDPTPQSFTKAVPSGQSATFNLLFGGPEYGIQPVSGFVGYIIISCNFRYAHGFGFISDPSNLQTAHGYLALILDPKNSADIWRQRATGVLAAEALDN
jgi:hypothetical protein